MSIQETTTIAPLKNVAICNRLLEGAMNRPDHLPGIVCLSGPSGWGKTFAASYTANKHRAYYVECRSCWTRKALLQAICKEIGVQPAATISEMVEQVAEQLILSGRPLIIDEMDHLVDKCAVEIVRDLYETSQSPILLIGEEQFPAKLQRWERFHNRVLEWGLAQPCDAKDAGHLAKLYVRDIAISDDLLEALTRACKGAARRICVNLDDIRRFAETEGLTTVSLANWGDRPFSTGTPPPRRAR